MKENVDMLQSYRRRLFALAGIVLFALQAAPAANAAEQDWKMHIVWVPTRQEAIVTQTWAERVNERAGDALQIEVFPSGALGIQDPDMLRILPPGNVIQSNLLSIFYVTRDAPDLGYLLPEGVLPTIEVVPDVIVPFNKAAEEAYGRFGIKFLQTLIPPDRSIDIFCKTPVNTLEELRTKKLRVWGAALASTFEKLGVAATVIPQSDLYMALQTGVVDCATYYPGAANTISLQEVAPYWAFLTPFISPSSLIVSEAAWSRLSPDTQAILQEEADQLAGELIEALLAGDYEQEQGAIFDAAGGQKLEPFPEADQRAFYEAAHATWVETAAEFGEALQVNREAMIAVLPD